MLKDGGQCTTKNTTKKKPVRQQILDGRNMLEQHVHPDFDNTLGVLHSCNSCRRRIKRMSEAMPTKKVYKPAKTPRTGRKRTVAPSAAHRKRWGAQQLRGGPAEWSSKCLHLFHMISTKRGSILFSLSETKVQAVLEAAGDAAAGGILLLGLMALTAIVTMFPYLQTFRLLMHRFLDCWASV